MSIPVTESFSQKNDLIQSKTDIKGHLKILKERLRELDIILEENFLKRYLYGTDFDVDESFRRIKLFHEHLSEYPDWYSVDGPLKWKSLIEKDVRVILPDCDKEGRPIYLSKNCNMDASTMSYLDLVTVDDIWIESILCKCPEAAAKGICVIVDVKDQNWNLTTWMHPNYVMQSLKKIDSLPFKDYKVHIINSSWWVSLAINFILPFFPQKYKEMAKFHFDDMETFYEYIDKDVLPVEYGGLKEIQFSELYENLYKKDNEIIESFESYRITRI